MKRDELKDAVSCFRLGNCTRQESDVRKWTIWTDNQDCAWRLFFSDEFKALGEISTSRSTHDCTGRED